MAWILNEAASLNPPWIRHLKSILNGGKTMIAIGVCTSAVFFVMNTRQSLKT
jgi:hypothetical protein